MSREIEFLETLIKLETMCLTNRITSGHWVLAQESCRNLEMLTNILNKLNEGCHESE